MKSSKKTKYQNIKPGLYFTGVNSNQNFDFTLIWVLKGKMTDYKEIKGVKAAWTGMVYNYFDLQDKQIYEFNEYWNDYIDELEPVKDQKIIIAAKRVIANSLQNLRISILDSQSNANLLELVK